METFKDLIFSLGIYFMKLVQRILKRFFELNFANKVILLNCFVAFFAIVLPIGRFYIFESWFYINNPIAIYLIAIVILMVGTMYISPKIALLIRCVVNLWFLGWLLYITFSHSISHAPYELTAGYYFNIVASFIYLVVSPISYFLYRD